MSTVQICNVVVSSPRVRSFFLFRFLIQACVFARCKRLPSFATRVLPLTDGSTGRPRMAIPFSRLAHLR